MNNFEIKIRKWRKDDLNNLLKYANNIKIFNNLTDAFPHPYTKEEGEKFIEISLSHSPTRIFAIDFNNEAIGSIGISPQNDVHKKNAEIGYWLAEDFWGKGIMPIAIKQIVKYGFDNFDINRIFARPFGSNKASQKVLEKAGFELEAIFKNTIIKNGQLLDEHFYAVKK